MENDQNRFERRPTQRFSLHLPVSIRLGGSDREYSGFTQDLSARGVLLYTELPLNETDAVEVSFMMPSEITLADSMRVRCRGKVVRVTPPSGGTARGVAVRIEGYEFLSEPEALTHSSEPDHAAVKSTSVQKASDSIPSFAPVIPSAR